MSEDREDGHEPTPAPRSDGVPHWVRDVAVTAKECLSLDEICLALTLGLRGDLRNLGRDLKATEEHLQLGLAYLARAAGRVTARQRRYLDAFARTGSLKTAEHEVEETDDAHSLWMDCSPAYAAAFAVAVWLAPETPDVMLMREAALVLRRRDHGGAP